MRNWTSKKESLLKFWQEECRIYNWLHDQNSLYYTRLDKCLSIPALLISAITSTAIFSNLGTDNNKEVLITLGSLLVIGTFLQSVRDFLNTHELIHKHLNTSKIYLSIANDIEEQLSQEREEREKSKVFIHKIKIRKNDIIRNSPRISSGTWNKLKKSIEKGDMINLNSSKFFSKYIQQVDKTMDYVEKYNNDNKNRTSIQNISNTQSQDNNMTTTITTTIGNNEQSDIDMDFPTHLNTPTRKYTIRPSSNSSNNDMSNSDENNSANSIDKKYNDNNNSNNYDYDDTEIYGTLNNTNQDSTIVNIEPLIITSPNNGILMSSEEKEEEKKRNYRSYNYNGTEYLINIESNENSESEESNELDNLYNNDVIKCQLENKLLNKKKQNKKLLAYQLQRN